MGPCGCQASPCPRCIHDLATALLTGSFSRANNLPVDCEALQGERTLLGERSQGQCYREAGTVSELALDRDRPPMRADDPLDNGEPESAAASPCSRARRVDAIEALEDVWEVLRCDADPGIADDYVRLSLRGLNSEAHTHGRQRAW